ncbi:MFS transporter [Sulfurimonas sp. HSL-1716]|uniref:MFS transporter n=1 Tax=Hydrocurvibacter sulfurireducens TaxID=3131937 RepID=UPI0031FA0AA6
MKQLFKVKGIIYYTLALFLNAFTDLGHKIIIQNTIFKVYDGSEQIVLTAVVNAMILLPFILLFTPSGYLSDRFPKNVIMKYSALFAVFITLGITFSYYKGWFLSAFFLTFLLALQSALYSPAKYGYIKELVGVKLLTGGNAIVQATTTVAILGGIIFYTVLFEMNITTAFTDEASILKMVAPLGWLLVVGSIIEYIFTSKLQDKTMKQSRNTFDIKKYVQGYYLRKNIKILTRKRDIIESVVALSVFWSISQVVLAIFGAYAKDTLKIDNTIYVQGAMALAGIGIILGSILASRFSRYYVHIGMVPFAAFGLSLMVLLLPFSSSFSAVVVLFMLFGIFAGLFIVPLNAYIQELAPRVHLGTILAGNNFVQNIFMFFFLSVTTVFAYFGMDVQMLFFIMFFVGFGMALYMLRRHIVMFLWFLFESVLGLRYKFKFVGVEHIPHDGAILFMGNHISWIDWIIMQFPIKRRVSFMMERDIYHWRFFHKLWKLGNAIPLSAKASKDAFLEAKHRIAEGGCVVIFPEGRISYTGEMGEFYRGYELIAGKSEGVIIPYYIGGMWGSVLSRSKKRHNETGGFFKRRITVIYGKPIPLNTKAEKIKTELYRLKEKYETK